MKDKVEREFKMTFKFLAGKTIDTNMELGIMAKNY